MMQYRFLLMTRNCNKYSCLIYFSSIVKQANFAYVNHVRIRCWNQPVLTNEGKVVYTGKHREPLMGLELHRLRVRRVTHCATSLKYSCLY